VTEYGFLTCWFFGWLHLSLSFFFFKPSHRQRIQIQQEDQTIRKYCETNIIEKHISTSVHHPQIMGKLSAFQKGFKRFLYYALGTSRDESDINHYIDVYVHWYNNKKYHSVIARYPKKRYSGQRDIEWYMYLVKSLN